MKPLFPDVLVNGKSIPSAAIAAEAQNHEAPSGKPGLAWKAAARALVVRELLLAEAAEQGVKADPAMLSPGKIETTDEAQIRGYLEEHLTPSPVKDDEVLAIFRQRTPEGDMPGNIAGDIRRKLEQRAWTNAASDVVARLVAKAEIVGIDMQKA